MLRFIHSARLKGTFYLIGNAPVVAKRLDAWRSAALNGHELGNHTLNHPCSGNLEGRSFVTSENDLSKYTVERAVSEIRVTNTLLQAIDDKTERTFAFPCGDTKIGDASFYQELEEEFAGARGVQSGFQHPLSMNLNDINCFMINGQSGEELINLVRKAVQEHALIVFLFSSVS